VHLSAARASRAPLTQGPGVPLLMTTLTEPSPPVYRPVADAPLPAQMICIDIVLPGAYVWASGTHVNDSPATSQPKPRSPYTESMPPESLEAGAATSTLLIT